MRTVPIFACVALVATLGAQTTFTSPAAAAGTEGNDFFSMFGNRRLQAIDSEIRTPIPNITAIAFRRDGNVGGGTPRLLDVSVTMGIGSYAAYSSAFSANFTWSTTVVATRTVTFPDWTPPPPVTPAPFTFVVPFDMPWTYTAQDALIWDITCTNASVIEHATMDRFGYSTATGIAGTLLGTGCVATGRASPFAHTAHTITESPANATMVLRAGGSQAPASTPVLLAFDFVDANLSLPGFCTTLHALGAILAPLTTSSAAGTIATRTIQLGYDPAFLGVPFYTQLLAFDAGQSGIPIAFSNGRGNRLHPYLQVAYVWGGSGASGVLTKNSTVPVARFTY